MLLLNEHFSLIKFSITYLGQREYKGHEKGEREAEKKGEKG